MCAWFRVDDVKREQHETMRESAGPSRDRLPSMQVGPHAQSALMPPGRSVPEAALSSEELRALYLKLANPDVARLVREIYRLQSLARRAAFFVDTAIGRGVEAHLDITSKVLLKGLDAALKAEPYIAGDRPSRTGPQTAVSRYRPEPGYQSTGFNVAFPEGPGGSQRGDDATGSREKLFTWKLCPEPGRADDTWLTSCYRGLVMARAGDPIRARELAAERFREEAAPAHLKSPWCTRRLVRVELVENSPFDRVEHAGVVYP